MALDVQHSLEEDAADLNTSINTTPLVDVMLVLLVIFLVTIPVVVQTRDLDLPNQRNIVTETKPENIIIEVDRNEVIYLNTQRTDLAGLRAELIRRNTSVGAGGTLPEVHIRADRNVRFEAVGRVILMCQQAAVQKVGFITMPMGHHSQAGGRAPFRRRFSK
jgi:biopolymer transport protein ExbD